ncbi:MAG: hypothetical protein ACREDR_11980 [Blastocatellia bacterium]
MRSRLPGAKAGEILDCLDRIELTWEKQPVNGFPFDTLMAQLEAIRLELTDCFHGDLDQRVTRDSAVFEQLLDFSVGMRIYNQMSLTIPVYQGIEERLHRLELVLPPKNFAIEAALNQLPDGFQRIRQLLEGAVGNFRAEQYEWVLRDCGRAEDLLFVKFTDFLARYGIGPIPDRVGVAIDRVRASIREGIDPEGFKLGLSERLERLVLSMFECTHYFRNLEAHPVNEGQTRLPKWQAQRRARCVNEAEYARLALFLSIQIALELCSIGEGETG